jgi:uncharacterized protein YciI
LNSDEAGSHVHFLLFYEVVADFADRRKALRNADPYVTNGLVTRWEVREWTTVVGHDAGNGSRHSI